MNLAVQSQKQEGIPSMTPAPAKTMGSLTLQFFVTLHIPDLHFDARCQSRFRPTSILQVSLRFISQIRQTVNQQATLFGEFCHCHPVAFMPCLCCTRERFGLCVASDLLTHSFFAKCVIFTLQLFTVASTCCKRLFELFQINLAVFNKE